MIGNQRPLHLAPEPRHETAEVLRAMTIAENVIATLPLCLTTGDEVFSALTSAVGYGDRDERLRGFCRALQKALERRC
jgi:hypothetical protein